jgi:Metallo-peptidase family M12
MTLRYLWLCVTLISSLFSLISASSVSRNPLSNIGAVTDASIHTPKGRITAHSTFDLTFSAKYSKASRRLRLSLHPNHDIILPDSQVHFLGLDGEVTHSEPIDRLEYKVYKGDVWAQNLDGTYHQVGHARISIFKDGPDPLFEGSFDLHNDFHHILLDSNYRQTKHPEDPLSTHSTLEHMVIFKDSDTTSGLIDHNEFKKRSFAAHDDVSPACGSDNLDFNMDMEHPIYTGIVPENEKYFWSMPMSHLFGKRQLDTSTGSGNSAGVNLVSTIGNPNGCPTTRKVALVGVATDCTYTGAFTSQDTMKQNVISVMNQASSLYESTFNISLGLQNITISPSECPGSQQAATPWNQGCNSNLQIQDRLNLFSAWRAKQQDSNSHWTMLTTCNSGTAVGLAWLGQACVINADPRNSSAGVQTVAGANVVARTSGANEWQIIA